MDMEFFLHNYLLTLTIYQLMRLDVFLCLWHLFRCFITDHIVFLFFVLQFQVVKRGKFRNIPVAVKQMVEGAMNEDDFIEEAKNMR